MLDRGQVRLAGVNFASHDYLSLTSHPAVTSAATEAIGRYGVHSAGPVTLQGGSPPLAALEERLADLLACRETTVFPTGWGAGYGAVRALVCRDRPRGDRQPRPCLFAGRRHGRHAQRGSRPHGPVAAIESYLTRIREHAPQAGILLVTQSLFAADSTVPDLRALQDACHHHEATLLVNVAHDFGAIGPRGLGFAGEQGMTGEIDVVVGSFSKTFAANGGFVACNVPGLKAAIGGFASTVASSSALSPIQAAVVGAALDVVCSREGAARRKRLMGNIVPLAGKPACPRLRGRGVASPIVPVQLGESGRARRLTRAALNAGVLLNLVEHPVVARDRSQWRLLVMADHTDAQGRPGRRRTGGRAGERGMTRFDRHRTGFACGWC